MQYITFHMLKGIDTGNYFKNYKRYITNPWIHSIPTCSISLLYHSDHLVPCENKPITMRFCCIHFAIEGKKILYMPVNHPRCKHQLHSLLCLWAHFTSGKHCNSGTKFCLMDTNSAIMHSLFFFFLKNTYICTGKNAKLKERKLGFSSWLCHSDSGQVNWSHFPHL